MHYQINISKPKLAGVLLIILSFATGFYFAHGIPAPSRSSIVEPGSLSENCSYVLYQDSGSFLANSCITGGNDFKESSADTLLSDMATTLATSGGEIAVQKGTWTLTSQFPTSNLKSLITLVGEGPTTLFQPSPVNFDPLNTTFINIFNLNMIDKHNVQVSFTCDLNCSGQQQQSFTLDTIGACSVDFPGTDCVYLGNYIRVDTKGLAAKFPAIITGFAIIIANATQSYFYRITIQATVRAGNAASFFPFFMEPAKGDFNDFIGFEWTTTANLALLTKVGGTTTQINAAHTLDTADHVYKIDYQCCSPKNEKVTFSYDGVQQGVSTTNILHYPGTTINRPLGPTLECCEPNGVDMSVYLKSPFMIPVTGVN